MKTKVFSLVLIFLYIGMVKFYAQESDVVKNLTEEQKEMIQSQKKLLIDTRNEFKATLTDSQLAILKDATLSKEDRLKTLLSSLSENQKKLLIENRKVISERKEDFKSSITEEQRQRIRNQIGPEKSAQEKRELRDRIIENRKRRVRN